MQYSPKLAMRALITHCFYRRVILWGITVIIVMCLMLFSGGVHTSHGRILDHLVDFGRTSKGSIQSSLGGSSNGGTVAQPGTSNIWDNDKGSSSEGQVTATSDTTNQGTLQSQGLGTVINPLHWLKYKQ